MDLVLQHANLTYGAFASEDHFIGLKGVPIDLNNAPNNNCFTKLTNITGRAPLPTTSTPIL